MRSKIFWIHALSPVHVGSGRGLGYIDLPIVREKVTNFPYIPGSAVKGVLADWHDASDDKKREKDSMKSAAFGISGDDASNSGSIVFTDARLVCLPIRSMFGTFAWCTSPTVLRRLQRDLKNAGETTELIIPSPGAEQGLHVDGSVLVSEQKILLEDIDVTAATDGAANAWAELIAARIFAENERTDFVKRFVILPDDVFNFLCETGTEVVAHIKIDSKTKTVARGALWYEESLPAEAILFGVTWCDKVYGGKHSPDELLAQYASGEKTLQFGGKATTGKGIVRCIFDVKGGD